MESPRSPQQNATRSPPLAYVETYGCQMNISDGELMEGILARHGYRLASTPDEADVILVNTCAVREHAEQRVLGRVAQLNRFKQERPELLIGVTGCMAQRLGETLLEKAPYVDLVMGPDGYRRLPQALARLRGRGSGGGSDSVRGPDSIEGDGAAGGSGGRGSQPGAAIPPAPARPGALPVIALPGKAAVASSAAAPDAAGGDRVAVLGFEAHENYEGLEARRRSGVTAWVPVQRGCDYRCTYCIVPYVRGPEKNRDPRHVLDEVRQIAAQGIPEVTLLGQTVNSYRREDWDFARLLREVARVDGIRRVRFTSPHPNDITPALVEVMASEPTVCKQLHLPVQAGHDRTLKRMLRRYTVATFLEKVRLVRDAVAGIALSTDVIVAFPGETESEFRATLDLMREVRFDDAYLYKYSPRDGTPATRLPAADFVDAAEAQRRLEVLIALQRGIQAEINHREVGRVVEVLVEREAKSDGDILGRTDRNKVVAFPGDAGLIGRFVPVRLVDTTGATFIGERVGEAAPVGSAA